MKNQLVTLILTMSLIITTLVLLLAVDVIMHILTAFKMDLITDEINTLIRYLLYALVLLFNYFAAKILIRQLLIASRKISQKLHLSISVTALASVYGLFCFCIKMFPAINPQFYHYPDAIIYLPFLCIIIYLTFSQNKKIGANY